MNEQVLRATLAMWVLGAYYRDEIPLSPEEFQHLYRIMFNVSVNMDSSLLDHTLMLLGAREGKVALDSLLREVRW